MSWDATHYTTMILHQWNLSTKIAPQSVLWLMILLKLITSWAVLWPMTVSDLQLSMIQYAHLLKLIQKVQSLVLRVNGGNITVKTLFGTAIHANTFTQWKSLTIPNGVLKQLDQTDQWKPLAGLTSIPTIYSQRQAPNISVKFGNFLILKKVSRLTFIIHIWVHFTMKPGIFLKPQKDTFFWSIAPTCPDGPM